MSDLFVIYIYIHVYAMGASFVKSQAILKYKVITLKIHTIFCKSQAIKKYARYI